MIQIDAKYKNSGILNNCGLASALPVILEAIKRFTKDDVEPNLKKHETSFIQLKNAFAKTYGLSNLSWTKLDNLMSKYNNNTAQQIIMGIAYRSFIAEQMEMQGQETSNIERLTTIQTTGRFTQLAVDELSEYAFEPLGISVQATESSKSIQNQVTQYNVTNPIAKIDIHNRGDHYEPVSDPSKLLSDFGDLSQDCPNIEKAVSEMTSNNSSTVSLESIEEIKKDVKNNYQSLNSQVSSNDSRVKFNDLTSQYVDWCKENRNSLFASKYSEQQIKDTINNLDSAEAIVKKDGTKETDEEFAERLQFAEYEKSKKNSI